MELKEDIESYIILAKFLKLQGASEEKLGKLFIKLIDSISFDDLNVFITKESFKFCNINIPNEEYTQGKVNRIELDGCAKELTEEEKFNSLIDMFVTLINKRKPVEI